MWSDNRVFDPASHRSLLTYVQDVNSVRHHTLIVDKVPMRWRYREIISFDASHVYPEYLIAYQRFVGDNVVGS